MKNIEYNTYQQYQGFDQMQKIFSLLRTDHTALLNIVSRDKQRIHASQNILQKRLQISGRMSAQS